MAKAVSQSFFVSDTLRTAWNILREHTVEVVAIYVVAGIAPQVIFFFLRQALGDDFSGLFMLVEQLVSIVLSVAILKAFLDIVQKRKIDVSFVWTDPKRVLNFVAGTVLYALIVIGGLLLLVVPGVIWSIKFRFFTYLIIEENLGPIEALKKSAQITEGVKWDILAFDMVLGAITLLGLLALVVGLIVAVPLVAIAQIVFYLRLAKRTVL